jgi:hypothetical protein
MGTKSLKCDGSSGAGETHGRGCTSERRCSVPIAKAGVRFGRLDDAIPAAVRQAAEAEEPRFIHRGMADFVILTYETPGTVAIVEKDGRVAGPAPAQRRKLHKIGT